MIEIVKSGSKYDFVGSARTFGLISAILVLGSLVLLGARGLNLGIDFKGGNKLIVAFKGDAGADRDKIREAVAALIKEKRQTSDPGQIEVQDFELGADDEKEGFTRGFQIYTELTTLITDKQTAEIQTELKAKLGIAKIDRPEETDKLIMVLEKAAPVAATKETIHQALIKLGYGNAKVTSEVERAMDMQFYKEYNLLVIEAQKAEQPIPNFDDWEKVHTKTKGEKLVKAVDRQFTINLQQIQSEFEAALDKTFGAEKVKVEAATSVSASVGSDLFNKGMLAMLYAIIGILIYIGLRFDFRYSPGAVVALIHDTTITLGIFALFGVKFTLPIISALLTIIGYSLNDTIVVYDRIRENLTKFKGMDFARLVNQSINETLSRTLNTSITTLVVVLALLFLGGGLIQDFALALTIGIVVGTYSSIFIASPIVLLLDRYMDQRKVKARGGSPAPKAAA